MQIELDDSRPTAARCDAESLTVSVASMLRGAKAPGAQPPAQ